MTEQIVYDSEGICPYCGDYDPEFLYSDQYEGIVTEDYECTNCNKTFTENYEIIYYETVYDDEIDNSPVGNKKTNTRW